MSLLTDGVAHSPNRTAGARFDGQVAGEGDRTQAAAATLYPGPVHEFKATVPNNEVAQLRADPARLLFPDRVQLSPVALRELALITNPLGTEAQLDHQTTELAAAFADVGASRDDVQMLAARVAAHKAEPATEADRTEMQTQSIKALRATYGDKFHDALDGARRLTKLNPHFAAYLEKTGAAFDPKVQSWLAAKAISQRNAGKLK